jgi:hypothetical protein
MHAPAMGPTLFPCPACSRHVRLAEPRCPFCDCAIPSSFAARPVPRPPPAGLNRATLHAYLTGTPALCGMVLIGTSVLNAACGGRTDLPLDPCAVPPAPPPEYGGFTGADYGAAPVPAPPQCQGDVAIESSPSDGVRCECGAKTPYLLCDDGYYAKCTCSLPESYVVCR